MFAKVYGGPYGRIKVDIDTCLSFVECFNGVALYHIVNWINDYDLELFTDSAENADLSCSGQHNIKGQMSLKILHSLN